ncbi:L-type lectin-domain containing receptor kinase SIT2 [Cryptomeria japonica]|uniref:L-type lectin-domain containing receptor kinase SIT2 n=1 Tax=Cryptomeria japonica TaxID=3369 RepID=UPI0027DA44AF|nr:L-type lectin-domain containing receptor kinase SIT2 [Cryptomeria japonica]
MSVSILVILVLHAWLPAQAQTSFFFNKFNATTLYQIGNTSIRSDSICLTNQSEHIFGRALYNQPVRMKGRGSDKSILSFSTTFVFAMVPSSSDPLRSGQGMTFIIAPSKSLVRASPPDLLGLFNLSTFRDQSNHLFAVEFDTQKNPLFEDIDDNHVGVDLNSIISVNSTPAGYWIGDHFHQLDLNSGHNIQAWIDYEDTQQHLNVTIVEAGLFRPKKPLLSLKVTGLSNIFEEEMYVGFSAATGADVEDHCVLAWSFSTNGSAPELDLSHLPSLTVTMRKSSNHRLIAAITATLVFLLLLVVVVGFFWWKRNKYGDDIEEWEIEYWPHRFDYKDLYIATKGFRDDQVLGSGGFGQVYKGIIPVSGREVAVKSIFKENAEALKEFIAEISSLGRLQHRNLVQIRGYCRRGAKFFIVYDYMPNGSLDKMIFQKMKSVLTWAQRYRILRDVAAGLLYLHEEWEQVVVHRDIKSSNVLLDSELNGKLGDFGLARLYEHRGNLHTTHVVGTLGYIAPELVHTGKAATSTDVFGFGILMLEVACGRRPVEPSLDASQIVMVDWVRDLHANGRLMDVADPNLDGEYDEDEMKTVLELGLMCCNSQPQARPTIRQVLQIIEDEVSIPPVYLGEMGGGSSSLYPSTGVSYASTSTSIGPPSTGVSYASTSTSIGPPSTGVSYASTSTFYRAAIV